MEEKQPPTNQKRVLSLGRNLATQNLKILQCTGSGKNYLKT